MLWLLHEIEIDRLRSEILYQVISFAATAISSIVLVTRRRCLRYGRVTFDLFYRGPGTAQDITRLLTRK